MDSDMVSEVIRKQKEFFKSGVSRDVGYRKEQLKKLHTLIRKEEGLILDALKKDMAKPKLEAYASEIAITTNEIKHAVRQLASWTKTQIVRTAVPLFPSRCFIMQEPLGVVLIIAPWNYPFQLIMVPLVGAMAAGNCALLKPSEHAVHTGRAIEELITGHFDPGYIAVATGEAELAKEILSHRFDHIFFTGGSKVAKFVMEAASHHLTPVTLELGGKSPCIVDRDVNIEYAARRIIWAKFFNAGQTCVAPDYLLIDDEIRAPLIDALKRTVVQFYGADPRKSTDYARIINRSHFDRLFSYLDQGNILIGGQALAQELYIAPTIMESVPEESPLMQEEIFGPILPIRTFVTLSDALDFVNSRPKPLALYLFTRDKSKQEIVRTETSSGGYCINDAMVHLASPFLPFGGVGSSGMGFYHGKAGFDTFSHTKSIVKNTLQYDVPLRYSPYRFKMGLVRWLF